MTTQPSPRPGEPGAPRTTGPDPGVAWSVSLHVLFFPWLLGALIALALVVSSLGVEFGGADDVATQRLLVLAFVLVALLPLAASAIIGLRVWKRRRRRGALVAGSMSIVVAVVVLIVAGTILLGGGA